MILFRSGGIIRQKVAWMGWDNNQFLPSIDNVQQVLIIKIFLYSKIVIS